MKVGIIGAGTMGSGIAQAFAQCADVDTVYLCDIKEEFAENGFNKIKKQLDKRVAKGKMEQSAADQLTGKIKTGLNTICTDADLIVEAALENMQIKKDLFKELQENIVKNPNCIFASTVTAVKNSLLCITETPPACAKRRNPCSRQPQNCISRFPRRLLQSSRSAWALPPRTRSSLQPAKN